MRFIYFFFAITLLMSFLTSDPATGQDKTRGYTAGKFQLEVGNSDAGWIMSTEGGSATSDVVQEKNSKSTALPVQNARPITPQLQANDIPASTLPPPCAKPPCTVPVRTPPNTAPASNRRGHTGGNFQLEVGDHNVGFLRRTQTINNNAVAACTNPPCVTPSRKPCPSGHTRGADGKCKEPQQNGK